MKALVTGASRGLGRVIASRLAADGYEVWLNYLASEDDANGLLAEIEDAGGSGRLARFDVSNEEQVESELVPLLADHGPLDVLVNNAGVAADGYLMLLPTDDWERVLRINLGGFFLTTRACLKGMVRARGGRVINIGSLAGERGNVGQVAYAASKAGLAGATRALALEMARWNILVNAVSPGPLDTGMAAGIEHEQLVKQIPLGRLGKAEEVAGLVAFLCSDDAGYITGQTISVNGGMGIEAMDPLTLLDFDARPDAIAVIDARGSQTRRQLLEQAAGLAGRLPEHTAGSAVIVTLDSGPRFVAALAGCWLAGATPVLLDPLVRHELDRAIEATGARAVISGPGPLAVALPPDVAALTPDQDAAEPWDAPAVDDDAPLVLMFTSGTTGKPALVPKSFAQLDVEVQFLGGLLERPRRVATLVPWCHILGFIPSFLLPLRLGGLCDLSAGISPRSMLRRAGEGRLDLVVAVPAIYRVMIRLLAAGDLPPIAPGCRFLCSGAPLPAETRARFLELTGRAIIDVYGSTEAGGVAYRTADGPWIPQPHVEWRIAPEGHLEVRSASVSLPGEDGYYRIGDLARPAGDGFTLEGRADDVVKIGGRRVSLGEVQQVVESCPGVEGAAVLAAELRGELRLLAYVEPAEGAMTGDQVKTFVRGRLADHKVPRVVRVLDQLPRTPAGKVDRREIARRYAKEA